ncbi:MAG TPA: hypothetical protein VJ994_03220 [Paracoccaceae bacterium]|nr:hypothetical protein [Paracoccaceae bacterium]
MAAKAGAAILPRSSLKTVDARTKLAQSLGTTTGTVQIVARASEMAGSASARSRGRCCG